MTQQELYGVIENKNVLEGLVRLHRAEESIWYHGLSEAIEYYQRGEKIQELLIGNLTNKQITLTMCKIIWKKN